MLMGLETRQTRHQQDLRGVVGMISLEELIAGLEVCLGLRLPLI